jgi:hypothetical protein
MGPRASYLPPLALEHLAAGYQPTLYGSVETHMELIDVR